MRDILIEKMMELRKENIPFAHAAIVRRVIPTSGKPGDHALITAEGKIYGWIGGGCTRGIVLKEALLSLQDNKPRLVSISKDQLDNNLPNTKTYRMTCQSGGAVEVYIEPMNPKPQILIFGNSHIGHALSKLAKVMDYRVTVAMTTLVTGLYTEADFVTDLAGLGNDLSAYKNSYIVICSQGDGDVSSLLKAIECEGPYLGFVASRVKANSIFKELRQHGVTFDQLKKIKTPAGIDIGGKSHEEAAISILAEIVKEFRQGNKSITATEAVIPNDEFYLNPVCKIPINKATAKHVIQYAGESVYFCCNGCKVSFEKEPEKYIVG